ncbi:MAG: class I SAM-dependent methyltransferase [Gammaproteobacteria bacterium]
MNENNADKAAGDDLQMEVEALRGRIEQYERGWPPGHFYSPIPSLNEIAVNEQRIFPEKLPDSLPSIPLQGRHQLRVLEEIESAYLKQPFAATAVNGRRYFFENDYYPYGEAIALFGIMRAAKPRRIIEIGGGFSTAAMLDINDHFFNGHIDFKIVEPYPDRLLELLSEKDLAQIDLRQSPVQNLETSEFSALEKGDILFIDSSHVSKTDSDVNHLIFRILPALQEGVLVHFHDIFYPFEYPLAWIYESRAWNECYLLRAFLQYNDAFRLHFFNSFMAHRHAARIANTMPLFAQNPGSSLWIEKLPASGWARAWQRLAERLLR